MRPTLWLSLALLVSTAACGKKTYTGYYALEARAASLVDQQGDDAYVDPQVDELIAQLDAVPDSAREKDRAVALSTSLRNGQQRVRTERAAAAEARTRDEAVAQNTAPPTWSPPPPPRPPDDDDAGAPDAAVPAPTEPVAGMSLADFKKYFGDCYSSGPAVALEGGLSADSYVLRDLTACRRFGRPGATTSLLFVDGGVWGTRTVTLVAVDAGAPRAAPPQAPPDAGAPLLLMPGAPLPEGYQRSTTP